MRPGPAAVRAGAVAGLALLGACVTMATQDLAAVGEGEYELEPAHASLTWRVRHQGLSNYTARFTRFDARLDFDPDQPAASSVRAVIDPTSVRTDHPTDADWDRRLAEDWFRSERFPQILFQSTAVEVTGPATGKVTGDLSFLGVTRPVVLDVTFNGTANSPFFGLRDLIGFSARGTLKRSEFGLTRFASIVGDEVEIIIEAEFVEAAAGSGGAG
jgi:polyisoprenoid-binding protein YceI